MIEPLQWPVDMSPADIDTMLPDIRKNRATGATAWKQFSAEHTFSLSTQQGEMTVTETISSTVTPCYLSMRTLKTR